jgi:23S rRNA (cytosine1962-C5)-methyltransferase
MIVDILREIFSPVCIYERSDVSVRSKEGLKETKGVLYGALPDSLIITENGVKLSIDLVNGQKTGYFLDQKGNRDNLKHYVKGKRVLDLFCNQGGFSLAAARYGAEEIIAVDVSRTALEKVEKNAELNGFSNITTREADVFDLLREYKKSGETFDVIILDPPAFTKSADTIREGYAGYRDINTIALKLLRPNGILFTCSCSQHLTLPLFLDMIKESASRSGTRVRLVELRTQGKDHAPLIGADEGLYLKAAVLAKVN